jgi:hypothetical protein
MRKKKEKGTNLRYLTRKLNLMLFYYFKKKILKFEILFNIKVMLNEYSFT